VVVGLGVGLVWKVVGLGVGLVWKVVGLGVGLVWKCCRIVEVWVLVLVLCGSVVFVGVVLGVGLGVGLVWKCVVLCGVGVGLGVEVGLCECWFWCRSCVEVLSCVGVGLGVGFVWKCGLCGSCLVGVGLCGCWLSFFLLFSFLILLFSFFFFSLLFLSSLPFLKSQDVEKDWVSVSCCRRMSANHHTSPIVSHTFLPPFLSPFLFSFVSSFWSRKADQKEEGHIQHSNTNRRHRLGSPPHTRRRSHPPRHSKDVKQPMD